MIGWGLFFITLIGAVALLVTYQRRVQAEQAQLREAQRGELADVREDAEMRVSRLKREADNTRGSRRDALAADLLPALDSLDLAIEGTADRNVREGLELARRELHRALERHDVRVVSPAPGDAFDPSRHEAVETVDERLMENGSVARCHRVGWTTKDRVLRPAMVGVVRHEVESCDGEAAPEESSEAMEAAQSVSTGKPAGASGASIGSSGSSVSAND